MNATLGTYVIILLFAVAPYGAYKHFVHMARKDGHR